jgi:iron complex transport system substrate-binding protein
LRWRAEAAVAAVALCAACGGAERAPAPLVDDAGRAVRLDGPARRIVSLSPATTELLFALGVGDRVVGRTRYGQDPPAARAVPSVGEGLEPNVEVIVARRPDLVVFYHSPANARARTQLDRLGIATASVALDGLDDLRRAARFLGRLTGSLDAADSAVRAFDRALREAAVPPGDSAPSVLLLAWHEPPIVIGGASFQSEIVRLAGGRNVFEHLAQPSATVGIETIAARDPDVVLLTGGETDPGFARRPEWRVVPAVAEARFVAVEGTAFAHPSFRAADAVRALRRALEPYAP